MKRVRPAERLVAGLALAALALASATYSRRPRRGAGPAGIEAADGPVRFVGSPLVLSFEACEPGPEGLVLAGASLTEHVGFSAGDRYLVLLTETPGRDFRGRMRRGAGELVVVSPDKGAKAVLASGVATRGAVLFDGGRFLAYFIGRGNLALKRGSCGPVTVVDFARGSRFELGADVDWESLRFDPTTAALSFTGGVARRPGAQYFRLEVASGKLTRTGVRTIDACEVALCRPGDNPPRTLAKLPGGARVIELEDAPALEFATGRQILLRGSYENYWVVDAPAVGRLLFAGERGVESVRSDGTGRRILAPRSAWPWVRRAWTGNFIDERVVEDTSPRLVADGRCVLAELRPPRCPHPDGLLDPPVELWVLAADGSSRVCLSRTAVSRSRRLTAGGEWVVFVERPPCAPCSREGRTEGPATAKRTPGERTLAKTLDGSRTVLVSETPGEVLFVGEGGVILECLDAPCPVGPPENNGVQVGLELRQGEHEDKTCLLWRPGSGTAGQLVKGQLFDVSESGEVVLACREPRDLGCVCYSLRAVRVADRKSIDLPKYTSNSLLSRTGDFAVRHLAGGDCVLTRLRWPAAP